MTGPPALTLYRKVSPATLLVVSSWSLPHPQTPADSRDTSGYQRIPDKTRKVRRGALRWFVIRPDGADPDIQTPSRTAYCKTNKLDKNCTAPHRCHPSHCSAQFRPSLRTLHCSFFPHLTLDHREKSAGLLYKVHVTKILLVLARSKCTA